MVVIDIIDVDHILKKLAVHWIVKMKYSATITVSPLKIQIIVFTCNILENEFSMQLSQEMNNDINQSFIFSSFGNYRNEKGHY